MNSILHKAGTRGHANHGWLDTNHTSVRSLLRSGTGTFGVLRVLNDDFVDAAGLRHTST